MTAAPHTTRSLSRLRSLGQLAGAGARASHQRLEPPIRWAACESLLSDAAAAPAMPPRVKDGLAASLQFRRGRTCG
jgi:hypothetical protein